MGRDSKWAFSCTDKDWLERTLKASPFFSKYNAPCFEFRDQAASYDHPDAVAEITAEGISFTDFGNYGVINGIREYLSPLIIKKFGKYSEE